MPVPLHPRKQLARGYNQSIVIAEAIQSLVPDTHVRNILRRTRMTPSQTFLSREKRLQNMQGAFACEQGAGELDRVIMIDDVQTTGATLNASALALRSQNVHYISAFTLAHG
ncbi:MAG: ComF family protein [Puniceicoccaceae bacterium]